MGPELFLSLLPLNLDAEDISDANVWVLPILKQYTVGARLKYFSQNILDMISVLQHKSHKVLTLTYSLIFYCKHDLLHIEFDDIVHGSLRQRAVHFQLGKQKALYISYGLCCQPFVVTLLILLLVSKIFRELYVWNFLKSLTYMGLCVPVFRYSSNVRR